MIKAIIIDDEERARRVLTKLITEYCSGIEVIAEVDNVPDAVRLINENNPDVVFCDIDMPGYTGFELLSFFKEVNFEIIFATGYSEFALKAFEFSAVDYLLKPIQIEKLEIAVDKLKEKLQRISMQKRLETLKENLKTNTIKKIALPVNDGLIFTDLDNIIAAEADGSYTNVCLSDRTDLLISKKIRFFEELLTPNPQFYRVHRSSIVNINYIKKYSRNDSMLEMENSKMIKIAREKKSEFEEHIKAIRL